MLVEREMHGSECRGDRRRRVASSQASAEGGSIEHSEAQRGSGFTEEPFGQVA